MSKKQKLATFFCVKCLAAINRAKSLIPKSDRNVRRRRTCQRDVSIHAILKKNFAKAGFPEIDRQFVACFGTSRKGKEKDLPNIAYRMKGVFLE